MSRKNQGFTLIELTLAMSFVSAMLVAIAMTVIQISNIYTRGITLRQVNQASRTIASDFQSTIAASSTFGVENLEQGRLCTGRYTYVWNMAPALEENSIDMNRFSDGEPVRFARVPDVGGLYCTDFSRPILRGSGEGAAVEFLDGGDRPLALWDIQVASAVTSATTKQSLYTIEFTIGTDQTELIDTSGKTCVPPSEGGSDTDYCATNKLRFTARAGIR